MHCLSFLCVAGRGQPCAGLFAACLPPLAVSAQEAGPDPGVSSHREFGPALQAARAISDVGVRDQWLGRIAVCEAGLGARCASLSTLSDIRSDLGRRDAIRSLADHRGGAAGGAAMADFDTLIQLITSTVAPDSWDEVGGAGAIEPFNPVSTWMHRAS